MVKKIALSLSLLILLAAASVCAVAVPQAQATSTVTMRFAVNGFSNYSGTVLTIDGVDYDIYTFGWKTFDWAPGSTHTVVAATPHHDRR
jgi:hypothetical protein